MKQIAIVLLVLVASLCACARQVDAQGPQGALARRLSEADRVVLINPVSKRTGATLSSAEAKRLVRALKKSKEIPPNVDAAIGYTLVFFSGTNRLATVESSQSIFWIGSTPYADKSGTLEAVYEQHPFMFTL